MNKSAYQCNDQKVSQNDFYTVACNPSRSVLVEACAGSGKTWMLVSRILRALINGAKPQEILAITFTKKAAGEMRERLFDWLKDFSSMGEEALQKELASRGVAPLEKAAMAKKLKNLYANLLNTPEQIQIKTFHSWFASLVKNAPIKVLTDLNLPTQYDLLEDDTNAIAKVWPRFYKALGDDTQLKNYYINLATQYSTHNLQAILEAVLGKRCEFQLADENGILENSVKPLAEIYPEFKGLSSVWEKIWQEDSQILLRNAALLLGQYHTETCKNAATDLITAIEEKNINGIKLALLTNKNEKRTFLKPKIENFKEIEQAQEVLLLCLRAQQQLDVFEFQQKLIPLSRLLIKEFSALKKEAHWLDMIDLEMVASRLLSDEFLSAWVLERLDYQVRHLLIDEFQDTSPLQWHALYAWLSNYTGAGNAPSIFIVGDPKQSIYRFRRADPMVFQAAKSFMKVQLSADILSCDHTRRNSQAVVNLVNQVFEPLGTNNDLFTGFRSHTTEAHVRGTLFHLPKILKPINNRKEKSSLWRNSLTTPQITPDEHRKVEECNQAAQFIANAIAKNNIQAKEIMVLARTNATLRLIQQELRTLGISTQLNDKSDITDAPAIQDILDLLTVLVFPENNLALARLLKSPIFGKNDNDLIDLKVAQQKIKADSGKTFLWFELLQQDHANIKPVFKEIATTLIQWTKKFDYLSPIDALGEIFLESDLIAKYAANTKSVARNLYLSQLNTFLETVLNLDGGNFQTPYSLLAALKKQGVPATLSTHDQAVQLLTIHAAKGLEAKWVVLLNSDPQKKSAQNMTLLIDWPGEKRVPQRFIFLAKENDPPLCASELLTIEKSAREKEELNALYVAITRCKESLILSSNEPHTANPNSWWARMHTHFPSELSIKKFNPPLQKHSDKDVIEIETISSLNNAQEDLASFASQTTKNTASTALSRNTPAAKPIHAIQRRALIGEAMHKILELWGYSFAKQISPYQMRKIKQEFQLSSLEWGESKVMAQQIISGQGAWVWQEENIAWAVNEAPISYQGKELRVDRLLCHKKTRDIWVIDYKSSANPLQDSTLLEQMQIYCRAIKMQYPKQMVRGAFLSASGNFFEYQGWK